MAQFAATHCCDIFKHYDQPLTISPATCIHLCSLALPAQPSLVPHPTLRANPLHTIHLRDEEATRDGILSAFKKHFLDNEQIQPNDTLTFYFTGYGSVEFPEKAPSKVAGEDMETIYPYDDRVAGVRGIPDRTLACLMRQLASIKGNNITAIYDSCHSGGPGRKPSDLENSRIGIPPPSSPFPKDLDKNVWECADKRPKDPDLPHAVLNSHILSPRASVMRSPMKNILREPERSLAKTTYIGLVRTLERPDNKPQIPKQTPYVEGNNKTRILFSMSDPGRCFLVSSIENGKFSVPADTILGVDKETEFTITSGEKRFHRLKPIYVLPSTSTDIRPSDSVDYDVIHSQFADGSVKLERKVQFTQLSAPTLIDANSLQFPPSSLKQLHVKLEQFSTSASGDHCPVENGKFFLTSDKPLNESKAKYQ
ncbi:hypothetical protein BYT27DRAFT_7249927 [Phlegmacium glaucopus]|nr:hypothetical protein BYT27DRAFT_7249927 [Phlegmacium glaucopus]